MPYGQRALGWTQFGVFLSGPYGMRPRERYWLRWPVAVTSHRHSIRSLWNGPEAVTRGTAFLSLQALIVLSACGSPPPTRTACVEAPASGFIGAGNSGGHITVAQIWPSVHDRRLDRHESMGRGEIATPPAHGTATLVTAAATQVTYTPELHMSGRTIRCRPGAEFHHIGAGSGCADRRHRDAARADGRPMGITCRQKRWPSLPAGPHRTAAY